MMKTETLTQIFSILILGGLILIVMLSIFASGMLDSRISADITGNDTSYLDELEPAHQMQLYVSGTTVRCEYTGQLPTDVSWSFGDGTGAVSKASAMHTYPSSQDDKRYLVAMYAVDEYGKKTTEFAVANVKGDILADITIPGTDSNIQIMTISLFIGGITMLVLAIAIFWIEIPPRAFTQKQRIILGIGLIFSGLIAVGFFNQLFGGL